MSDLLKVKVGGSDYLCKWEENKVIYETDFSHFDLQSKIDYPERGIPTDWSGNNSVSFNSENDYLLVTSIGNPNNNNLGKLTFVKKMGLY